MAIKEDFQAHLSPYRTKWPPKSCYTAEPRVEVSEDVPDVLSQMGKKGEFQDLLPAGDCLRQRDALSAAAGTTAPFLINIKPQFS